MSKGQIQVNMGELVRLSQTARKDITAIDNALRLGAEAVAGTASGPWAGQAGDITRSHMQQFAGTRPVLTDRITRWANFLDFAASKYEEAESQIMTEIGRVNEMTVAALGARTVPKIDFAPTVFAANVPAFGATRTASGEADDAAGAAESS